MPTPRSRQAAALVLVVALWSSGATLAQRPPRPTIDEAFAEYSTGDHAAPARLLPTSLDFQRLRLAERRRLDRWLGDWNPGKAIFLLELANRASLVAPAYNVPLLTTGREYLARQSRPNAVTRRAEFDRLWHQVALATLQRYQLADQVERYAAAVAADAASSDPELTARLQFARAVAQEQRCWAERPALVRTGTPVREANYAPLAVEGKSRARGTPIGEISRRLACLEETATRFSTAAAGRTSVAEARVRLAWTQFQLGRLPEARASLDAVESGDDRELEYWARLFRGRIEAAQNRSAEAEGAFRSALDLFPHAQSAGVGLALVLFDTNRAADADAVATALRARTDTTADPWWAYLCADARFIDRWITQLRGSTR